MAKKSEPKNPKLKGRNRGKGQIRMIQVVITASALVLGAGGGWLWWSGPRTAKIESISNMQERTAKLRAVNEKTRRALVELGPEGIENQLAVYLKQETFLRGMVPPEDTVSKLMIQVTQSTRKNAVSVSEFSRLPRKEVGGFAANGFALKLTGKYHDVGATIAELLGAERIVHIYRASITAVAPDAFRGQNMAARDLQSLNFGAQSRQSWNVDARFEIYELGISKTPTKMDLQEKADSLAKVQAEAAKARKLKKKNPKRDSAAAEAKEQ